MTKVKKWQCPHCPQDCPRRWNAVVHIKRKHGGVGDPVEKENMGQHSNSSSGGDGRPTQGVKYPSSYNRSNHLYTNRANQGSKGHEDMIDKWYQIVLEQEEEERKIRKIKEFYCKNPDAPMPIPNIDTSNLPIKNMLEQCPPQIFRQNEHNEKPSPRMPGYDNRNKTVSQKSGGNNSLGTFPSQNRNGEPQSIQPVPMNYDDHNDDDDRFGIHIVKKDDVDDWGFKVTWTLKYNRATGDLIDAWVTDGLYEYLSERDRRREKSLQEYLPS